ncbi:3-phosphoshikimate 1-carboxyvinyltransferase [uncultured Muribaculum sp.]|uniref:3-phosphoshikimate 1-carboxyvinyltransferase n=1 Tax=uncultured Muribaculum sp. TaxID=1918613 RepID=UPI0025CEC686|nr:3-phosphoshikimate 1-carboxyvinyltransferase [uncultured Muribaculum sp.]
MDYRIFPPEELPEAIVGLPLSKSISNRVLIINALAGGAPMTCQVARCDDTDVMVSALESEDENLSVGAAGTAMRFLTAYFAAKPGRTVSLDGSERMRRRPIAPLVDALRECGAEISYLGEEGFPPLRIAGKKLHGGEIALDGSVSSQFVSALLMIAPAMSDGLVLRLEGDVVSQPYIAMTLGIMAEWGVDVVRDGDVIRVPHCSYTAVQYHVEADWSAASYWYELQSFSFGTIGLRGLMKGGSLQGDSVLMDIYRNFGIVTEESEEFPGVLDLMADPDMTPRYEADFSAMPDLAQTVVVSCCMLGVPFHITGLRTLKIKETDRLEALRKELMKISFVVDIDDDSISWEGRRCPVDGSRKVAIDTYDDHRMAMAFAPVAWYIPGLIIRNAEVVSKSYPDYWNHLRAAGFVIDELAPQEGDA